MTTDMTAPEVAVHPDAVAAASAAAVLTGTVLGQAVSARGEAHWATTGGSSPVGLYQALLEAPARDLVSWEGVHVWWGDDRFVPRDHPLSNVKAFDDILVDIGHAEEGTAGGPTGLPIPVAQIHPWPTGEAIGRARGAAWCAATLADELRRDGPPSVGGWPAFDLLMLGIGSDGHILSVFPGSAALGSTELALAIPAPTHIEPHVERVTLNPAVVGAARRVLVLVTGGGKAAVLGDIFGEPRDPVRLPAQLALRDNVTWILDEAAAAALPR